MDFNFFSFILGLITFSIVKFLLFRLIGNGSGNSQIQINSNGLSVHTAGSRVIVKGHATEIMHNGVNLLNPVSVNKKQPFFSKK